MKCPKPIREVNKKFLEFIKTQPCCVCGSKSEPHHTRSVGSGGSDMSCVGLCRQHHAEVHQIGKSRFKGKYGFDLEQVNRIMVRGYELS